MRRQRILQVRRKPKSWSIGILVAGVVWLLGLPFFGYNIWFLIGCCVLSFIVDEATTGSSTREDVYMD